MKKKIQELQKKVNDDSLLSAYSDKRNRIEKRNEALYGRAVKMPEEKFEAISSKKVVKKLTFQDLTSEQVSELLWHSEKKISDTLNKENEKRLEHNRRKEAGVEKIKRVKLLYDVPQILKEIKKLVLKEQGKLQSLETVRLTDKIARKNLLEGKKLDNQNKADLLEMKAAPRDLLDKEDRITYKYAIRDLKTQQREKRIIKEAAAATNKNHFVETVHEELSNKDFYPKVEHVKSRGGTIVHPQKIKRMEKKMKLSEDLEKKQKQRELAEANRLKKKLAKSHSFVPESLDEGVTRFDDYSNEEKLDWPFYLLDGEEWLPIVVDENEIYLRQLENERLYLHWNKNFFPYYHRMNTIYIGNVEPKYTGAKDFEKDLCVDALYRRFEWDGYSTDEYYRDLCETSSSDEDTFVINYGTVRMHSPTGFSDGSDTDFVSEALEEPKVYKFNSPIVVEDDSIEDEEIPSKGIYKTFKGINLFEMGKGAKETIQGAGNFVSHLVQSIMSMIKKMLPSFFYYKVTGIASLVLFIIQMARARNAIDASLAVSTYLMSSNYYVALSMISGFLELQNKVVEHFATKNDFQPESAADYFQWAKELGSQVWNSELITLFRKIALGVIGFNIFDKDITKNVFKFLGSEHKSLDVASVLSSTLDMILALFRSISAVAKGVPLTQAFFSLDPLQTYTKEAEALLYYEDKLYSGRPDPGGMYIGAFIQQGDDLSKNIEDTLKIYKYGDEKVKKLRGALIKLKTSIYQAKKKNSGGRRPPPIWFVIFGDPGLGKAEFVNFLFMLVCEYFGWQYDPSYVFHRTMASEFLDGYKTYGTPFMHYSEPGSSSETIAKMQIDKAIAEILSIVDTQPFATNQSAVENKGVIWARPLALVSDSNNKFMNIDLQFKNPAAFKRRGYYINMKVAPGFMKDGIEGAVSSAIDPRKSLNDPSLILQRYLFTVEKFVPMSSTQSYPMQLGEIDMDVHHFADLMRKLIAEHFRDQKEFASRLLTEGNSTLYGNPMIYNEDNISEQVRDIIHVPPPEEAHLHRPGVCAAPIEVTEPTRQANPTHTVMEWVPQDPAQAQREELEMKELVSEVYIENGIILRRTPGFQPEAEESESWFGFWKRKRVKNHHRWSEAYLLLTMGFKLMFLSAALMCLTPLTWFADRKEKDKLSWKETSLNVSLWILPFLTPLSFILPIAHTCFIACVDPSDWCTTFFKLVSGGVSQKIQTTKKEFMYRANLSNWDPLIEEWFEKHGEDCKNFVKAVVFTTFSVGAVKMGYDKFASYKKLGTKPADGDWLCEESAVTEHSDQKEELESIEREIDCGQSYKRFKTKQDIWNVREVYTPKCAYTGKPEEFTKLLMGNMRRVRVVGKGSATLYAFGVCGPYFLISSHAFKEQDVVSITVALPGKDLETGGKTTILTSQNSVHLGNDLTLVKLEGVRCKDLRKHLGTKQGIEVPRNGYLGFTPIRVSYTNIPGGLPTAVSHLSECLYYEYDKHALGHCGTPIFVAKNNGYCVQGIHAGTYTSTQLSVAAIIDREAVEAAINMLSKKEPIGFDYCQNKKEFLKAFEDNSFVAESLSEEFLTNLLDPHPKSYFMHNDQGCLDYYGRVPGNIIANSKSRLFKTKIGGKIVNIVEDVLGKIPHKEFGIPLMGVRTVDGEYQNPWNDAVAAMAKKVPALSRTVLKQTNDIIFEYIKSQLPEGLRLRPYDFQTAINGVEYDQILSRLKSNTSAGFGLNGKKGDHLPIIIDSGYPIRGLSNYLAQQVVDIFKSYKNGENVRFAYQACLKDEPREITKCKEGKTRVYYASPLVEMIISRMLIGPLNTLAQEFPEAFKNAIGLNVYAEAERFIAMIQPSDDIKDFGDLDIKKYDTSQLFEIHEEANALDLRLLAHYGYIALQLFYAGKVLTQSLFPYIILLNDVFCAAGKTVSGKDATARFNSRDLLFMFVYLWVVSGYHTTIGNFFDHVFLLTLGDDAIYGMSSEAKKVFTVPRLIMLFKEHFDIVATPGDKDSEARDTISLEELSFLKRRFYYNDEFKKWTMRLSWDSIFRMVTWGLPSQTITEEERMKSVLESFLYEVFLWTSKQEFEDIRERVLECYYSEYTMGKRVPLVTRERIVESMFSQVSLDYDGNEPSKHGSAPAPDLLS